MKTSLRQRFDGTHVIIKSKMKHLDEKYIVDKSIGKKS